MGKLKIVMCLSLANMLHDRECERECEVGMNVYANIECEHKNEHEWETNSDDS